MELFFGVVELEAALLLYAGGVVVIVVVAAPQPRRTQLVEAATEQQRTCLRSKSPAPILSADPKAEFILPLGDALRVRSTRGQQADTPHHLAALAQHDSVGFGSGEDGANNLRALLHRPMRWPPRHRANLLRRGEGVEHRGILHAPLTQQKSIANYLHNVSLNNPQSLGYTARLQRVTRAEFGEYVLSVAVDRVDTYRELRGYVFALSATANQRQNLLLALREDGCAVLLGHAHHTTVAGVDDAALTHHVGDNVVEAQRHRDTIRLRWGEVGDAVAHAVPLARLVAHLQRALHIVVGAHSRCRATYEVEEFEFVELLAEYVGLSYTLKNLLLPDCVNHTTLALATDAQQLAKATIEYVAAALIQVAQYSQRVFDYRIILGNQ